ncbi:uncharacterized protein [Solanum tuberosum]|uniref:uncharacterized protein n=1 Tax=Solanum tuberosum TaxID=4113 RepID=UPI00073A0150|nr:PREDICTED: uncharacterized protein LOC107058502 [Solanum tuberosum]
MAKACNDEYEEYEEENKVPEHVTEEFQQFENQHKPNLEETETVNLGDEECVKEVRISVHLTEAQKRDLIHLLREYIDVFVWSYKDMPGLSTNMVSHKLPINPDFNPVKQKTRKFMSELILKIKEEITKQIESQVVEVTRYPTWLANLVPSFVDCYAGYHQILMDEEDVEKTAFITPWGVYHYRVMPFGLKNVGVTYMRAMTTIFHDMIHKEIEVYVDDVIIKSRESSDHWTHLRKFFDRLHRDNLKLNPSKCAFGVPAGKLLGFIVSRRGDPGITSSEEQERDASTKWTEECQTAFDTIKNYLSNPPVLVPSREGIPLLLYLSVSDNTLGCVLGQHDETGKKEQAIYYLSKRMDPLKYIFQKAMPIEKLAKWQMLLSEFDIVYVTQKAIKAQALADHLAENPVDEEYEPLKTYFPDEEVSFVGEDIYKVYPGWRVFFDGAANHQGKGIGAVLVSESGQHYPMAAKLLFDFTNNMAKYKTCILGLKMTIDMNVHELLVIGDSDQGEWAVKNPKITSYVQYIRKLCKRLRKIEFRHTPRTQNELADALATIASMIKHSDTSYIDPFDIEVKEQHVHCSHVEAEPDGLPGYFDIKRYLETETYPENATFNQKKSIRRMTLNFFASGEIFYRRTPNLGLLKCVNASEAAKLLEQIHVGVCGTHMNGLTLARKILRAGYFWMTMEHDCCKFGVPEFIITDNGTNLNSHLMREIYEQFKITHRNSTAYRPQMNGAVEAANKNIKKILRKMIDNHRGWHDMFPYALLGYRTTVKTSIGATPYLLVYGTEAVIPTEVEIPSLRIIQEVELSDADWIRKRIDQLTLIDEKRMVVVCHGQLYRQRKIRAFHKRVRARIFEVGQLVLKRIFPHQAEYKGKFAPN